jgi:aryl-alcohol dehydrogenase-like predicted oxidoreductase
MRYVKMGPREVSVVGLGTWQFGEPGWGWGKELDYDGAARIVQRALELGINFFDTAPLYGNGRSEEILGEVLGERRHDVVVTTKVAPPLEPGRVKWAAERSLHRLALDSVELYQLHAPDNAVPIARTMEALRELMDSGQVRQVGVSNFGLNQWQRGEAALGRPVISNQVEYHLLERRYGESLLPHARQHGRVVIAYSPLAQGLLTGKYGRGNIPEDLRARYGIFNRRSLRRAPAIVDSLKELGQHHGATPAQVALAWLLKDPQVVVIPGARSVEQLEANAAAADLALSPEEVRRLDQVSQG